MAGEHAVYPNREAMDRLFRGDGFAGTLGVELVDWGPGWADVAMELGEGLTNFGGTVHGGVVFSVGDIAFSVACNSWGRQAVALAVDVQFLAAVPQGSRLLARARERSTTRRTGAYLVEVLAGDRLVASLHAMAHRSSRWHLGERAWDAAWREAH